MTPLTGERCVPCRGGVQPLTADELSPLLGEIQARWAVVDGRLRCHMTFPDFASAFRHATAIGALAEAEGHHPDLHLGWGYLDIELVTHAIAGLTRNDFILAAKIDSLEG